ncbi:hypothetical protein TIFTF001_021227 [Ficus carica]|uniref:Uncharacterized protein n=1 Tax=Ficus carica TaxID=3494 RepID=A0AA88ASC2_FICCA|nr:hypothetical protein TIFTF001_021227 [Ficus carica]
MQGFGSSSSCSTFGTDPEDIQARMEEYMKLNTLEIRLHDLIRRPWPPQYSVSPNPSTVDIDSEICRTRTSMKLKIFQRRLTQPVHYLLRRKFMDLATNLEEGPYQNARSMVEEYMNMDTFESRFANLFKFDSNSSPSSTTISTSGRSTGGASDMSVTRDDSSALTNVDNRNMLQTDCSFNRSDGTQLPVLHQQNALPPHMQNSSNSRLSNDLENLQARAFMCHHFLRQRFPQPISEEQRRKIRDIVRLLEDGLFRTSHTKEEYMNLETLESRLHSLTRHPQPHPQLSPSTSNFVNTQDIEYLLRELALD